MTTDLPARDLLPGEPDEARRPWLQRLLALALVPVAFGLLELGLRAAGFGHATEFLVAGDDPDTLTSNTEFSRRFFPPGLARAPVPFVLEPKADGAIRLFVVGGSAARGTPDPAFGLSRVLEARLEAAFPGQAFEVRNAALTAVNSHVVLPLVRDLVRRGDADGLIVYLGNNEVVGPYGAASVLGDFTPRLGMVRSALRLKTFRIGQALDRLLAREAETGWRGMEMFLEHQVSVSDPRLETVYGHFAANLGDIVHAARSGGVPIVLSTVAVNLRDQPPFAPVTSPELGATGGQEFEAALATSRDLLTQGDIEGALRAADRAVEIDGGHAGSHFERGRALAALGRSDEARESLSRARDLDALRFRADSRINQVIRDVAAESSVPVVDAAEAFAAGAGGPTPLPGHRVFLEHVHLNFQGTTFLADLLVEPLGSALPALSEASAAPSSPSPAALAEALPFTPHDALEVESEILELVRRAPFVAAPGHGDELARRARQRARLRQLAAADQTWRRTEALYTRRLDARPQDLQAKRRWAELLDQRGDAARSAPVWQELAERMPQVRAWQRGHGLALGRLGEMEQARSVLESVAEKWPERAAEIFVDLGALHQAAGDAEAAENAFRRAAAADPSSPVPPFNLALLQVERGELDPAVEAFKTLLAEHPDFLPARRNLGVALERLGKLDAAAAAYREEIEADPHRAGGHAHLGSVLEQQGKTSEALESYGRAVALEPDHAPALFSLGDFLLARGEIAKAAPYYRQGLAADPGNLQARHNLAKVLLQEGQAQAAIGQLRLVAAARPTDPLPLVDAAAAFEALGQKTEARAALEQALELARLSSATALVAEIEKRLTGD